MRSETGAICTGSPPRHSRFKKGQSGNPGGRPSGMTQGRATELALKQAFRRVTIREGGKVFRSNGIRGRDPQSGGERHQWKWVGSACVSRDDPLFEAAAAAQAAANQAAAGGALDATKTLWT